MTRCVPSRHYLREVPDQDKSQPCPPEAPSIHHVDMLKLKQVIALQASNLSVRAAHKHGNPTARPSDLNLPIGRPHDGPVHKARPGARARALDGRPRLAGRKRRCSRSIGPPPVRQGKDHIRTLQHRLEPGPRLHLLDAQRGPDSGLVD
jgi:hypothetical protein